MSSYRSEPRAPSVLSGLFPERSCGCVAGDLSPKRDRDSHTSSEPKMMNCTYGPDVASFATSINAAKRFHPFAQRTPPSTDPPPGHEASNPVFPRRGTHVRGVLPCCPAPRWFCAAPLLTGRRGGRSGISRRGSCQPRRQPPNDLLCLWWSGAPSRLAVWARREPLETWGNPTRLRSPVSVDEWGNPPPSSGTCQNPLSSWNLRERRWENSIDFPFGRWASSFPFGRRFMSSTHSRFRMC